MSSNQLSMTGFHNLRDGGGRRVHFIGIAGVGMSAVAKILLDCGWTVSGSDSSCAPPVSLVLGKLGIVCKTSYSPSNLPSRVDLVVIGKHERLRPETNGEVRAAFELAVPVVSYPDILAELTRNTTNLVVAGSYGKSTITALLSFLLYRAGHNPSFMIGAIPQNTLPPSRLSSGSIFVLEGDEYPSSNWDSRSKFLHYNPTHVLLTSCERDHVNLYKTSEDYLKTFRALSAMVPFDGLRVTCPDKPGTANVMTDCNGKVITFSAISEADYAVRNVTYAENISFELIRKRQYVCTVKSKLFGLHNVENILAASALLLELGLVEPDELVNIVSEFEGIMRRLEPVKTNSRVPVYEDIASSRGKARASIAAIRSRHSRRRLVVVFQPYSLSFRDKIALSWYRDVFEGVGLLILVAPPPIGNSAQQLGAFAIRDAVINSGVKTVLAQNLTELSELVDAILPDDVVLVMSSGPVNDLLATIEALTSSLFREEGLECDYDTLSSATITKRTALDMQFTPSQRV